MSAGVIAFGESRDARRWLEEVLHQPILDRDQSGSLCPQQLARLGMDSVSSMTWMGNDPNKGLAVLAFGNYELKQVKGTFHNLQWIDRVTVTGPVCFNLIPVWAANQRAQELHPQEPTTRQPTQALRLYEEFIASAPTLMAGDFNNHFFWDKPGKDTNFGEFVNKAARAGLTAAYVPVENLLGHLG